MTRGRPPYKPTDETRGLVRGLAMTGTLQEEIAQIVGVDPKTLRKHFLEELDPSTALAWENVARAISKTASGPKSSGKRAMARKFLRKYLGSTNTFMPVVALPKSA